MNEVLYTNGRRLISPSNNTQNLDDAVAQLTEHMLNEKSADVEFIYSDEEYPHYIVPEGVTSETMMEVLAPYLQMKAINENELVVDLPKSVTYKHTFTPDEKVKIAETLAETIKVHAETDQERRQVAKEFKDKCDAQMEEVERLGGQYRQGYEMKTEKAIVVYDFKDKVKHYKEPNTDKLLKTEDFKPEDFQLKIQHGGVALSGQANETEGSQDGEANNAGGLEDVVDAGGGNGAVVTPEIQAVVDGESSNKEKIRALHFEHKLDKNTVADLLGLTPKTVGTNISKIESEAEAGAK